MDASIFSLNKKRFLKRKTCQVIKIKKKIGKYPSPKKMTKVNIFS